MTRTFWRWVTWTTGNEPYRFLCDVADRVGLGRGATMAIVQSSDERVLLRLEVKA